MNLPSLLVVVFIVSLLLFFVLRSVKNLKSGETKCSGCTVTSCPLSSYATKSKETKACCQNEKSELKTIIK